jgi:catechol 2,3-dioxygenase-like lactoylglutathione lyase family enzyme
VIRVSQFDHVNLNVREIERSLRFYRDVLGLPLVRRDVDAGGQVSFVAVKAGPQIVDLRPVPDYEPPARPDPRTQGFNHLAFAIEPVDADALVAHLKGRGVEIQRGPVRNLGARGLGTALYVYDPDRYVVELKFYPPGAAEVSPLPT